MSVSNAQLSRWLAKWHDGITPAASYELQALMQQDETSEKWVCSCGHENTVQKLFLSRCRHCGEIRAAVEPTPPPPQDIILCAAMGPSGFICERTKGHPGRHCDGDSRSWSPKKATAAPTQEWLDRSQGLTGLQYDENGERLPRAGDNHED